MHDPYGYIRYGQ